jgi:hypothetical protein
LGAAVDRAISRTHDLYMKIPNLEGDFADLGHISTIVWLRKSGAALSRL